MKPAMRDPLKEKLEETVAREFLLAIGNAYRILRAGLPPEPDIMCEHQGTGKQVGVEVGTVYYNNDHAKDEWKAARKGTPRLYTINRPAENVPLLAKALRRIRAKSKKPYAVTDHLILVVFMYPQRLYLCDLEKRIETLSLPTHHRFDEIVLMSQHGEVYRLFPDKTWLLR
jgi:hypothetical protein